MCSDLPCLHSVLVQVEVIGTHLVACLAYAVAEPSEVPGACHCGGGGVPHVGLSVMDDWAGAGSVAACSRLGGYGTVVDCKQQCVEIGQTKSALHRVSIRRCFAQFRLSVYQLVIAPWTELFQVVLGKSCLG